MGENGREQNIHLLSVEVYMTSNMAEVLEESK